MIRLIIHCC